MTCDFSCQCSRPVLFSVTHWVSSHQWIPKKLTLMAFRHGWGCEQCRTLITVYVLCCANCVFHPLLLPFWMADTGVLSKLNKLLPSFLTQRCHRSLWFCFLLCRNHPVFSFSYSHKMPICFSRICSPFPFSRVIIFSCWICGDRSCPWMNLQHSIYRSTSCFSMSKLFCSN